MIFCQVFYKHQNICVCNVYISCAIYVDTIYFSLYQNLTRYPRGTPLTQPPLIYGGLRVCVFKIPLHIPVKFQNLAYNIDREET